MTRSLRSVLMAVVVGLVASLLAVTTASAAPVAAASRAVTAASSSDSQHITIPKSYQYHPHRGPDIALHDYCTASPDEYPTIGTNANFRGSCARHDMCIQYHTRKRSDCDAYLLSHMKSECRYTYSHWYDPRRGGCINTAYIYWLVVRVKTVFS